MLKLNCAACGAEVLFKSNVSIFGICSHCDSMLVRHDMNLENLGKMGELPADLTPLQIGTRGKYLNSHFELIGRLKIGWQEGFWNEWYALFDNGKEGWLAEAQGFLMVSFEQENPANIPERSDIQAGKEILLNKINFQIDDIKEATCLGSEGELPMKAPKGRKSTSVDLSGSDEQFACIDYSEDGTHVYIGHYVDFDQFKFTGLRELDGW